REIAEIIVAYNTPGDVAAMGMESADMDVIEANDLKATPDEVFFAIELLNEVGGVRSSGNGGDNGSNGCGDRDSNGLPALLPGINFVHGLKGESKKTMELNYEFLKKVLDAGLMLRRINIRQVIAFQDTSISGHVVDINKKEFLKYKERVRKEIDYPMLKRIVPQGTVLTDVIVEVTGSVSFARQLGSYPLLVGIPAEIPVRTVMDVAISGYGQRSITAVPYPLDINTAPHSLIQTLPYVGKKRAAAIARHIPFKDMEEFMQKVDGAEMIAAFIRI
ncbi:MAG: radical SAM protein, partial [Methanosarcinales archaeon]|nr:radical SAM protein [Methanosarcinales archaeon]